MGTNLPPTTMDIIKFQSSDGELVYICNVTVHFNLKIKLFMIYLFCFISYECIVYTVLFNKGITKNIGVLNNEIMSFKIASRRL